MRKRIQKIARGKFETIVPQVVLSESEVSFDVPAGRDYEGVFVITTSNDGTFSGVVYTTDSRMECQNPQFTGVKEARIRYAFHSRGLAAGEYYEGCFQVVMYDHELRIPYHINVVRPSFDSSIGKISSLEEFAGLARENYEEAERIFRNPAFTNILDRNDIRLLLLHKGLVSGRATHQVCEEFLIAAGCKARCEFSVTSDAFHFHEVSGNLRQNLPIRKSTWGYLQIRVSCDSEFVRLSNKVLRDRDFIGSIAEFSFEIDHSRMHSGRNYAVLTFESVYQKLEIAITAEKAPGEEAADRRRAHLKLRGSKAGLWELYQAYRMKRITAGVWANETIEILQTLTEEEPEEKMYPLIMAQAYLSLHENEQASGLLATFAAHHPDRKSPEWAYYLYLLTLTEDDPALIEEQTRQIRQIFRENPDSVLSFWVLSFLEEDYYNNSSNKLKSLQYWIMKGYTSPYLYLEAYYLIRQDPYLLSEMGPFEIRLLSWTLRHKAITEDIAMQIFEVVENCRVFEPVIYRMLCAAYEIYPKDEYVETICSYLIKGNAFAPEYLKWYQKGIELELKLTRLYDAYLRSLDEHHREEIPRIIQMYFQYESNLPWQKLAILYSNIIINRDKNREVYESYRTNMCNFAREQAAAGHMDENLAVIYRDMLEYASPQAATAVPMAELLYTNLLTVADPSITRACVWQWEKKEPEIVSVTDGRAYVQLYSEDYVILLENAEGQRLADSVRVELVPLLEAAKYHSLCLETAPQSLPLVIAGMKGKAAYTTFTKADEAYFDRILLGTDISSGYQLEMWPEILRYQIGKGMTLDETGYTDICDPARLADNNRKFFMNLLVEQEHYEQAWEMVRQFGIDQISPENALKLEDYQVTRMEDEGDDYLAAVCAQTFLQDYYSPGTLSYLCSFFAGSLAVMLQIYEAAGKEEISVRELEERILITVLLTDADPAMVAELFIHHYLNGASERITMAYTSYCSHLYFLDGKLMPELLYTIIESRFRKAQLLNDVCCLALLKYYSTLQTLTPDQYRIADELLGEYTIHKMNFAFYRQLPQALVDKYHLYDKVFLEYRTLPGSHVVLHYSFDGEELTAEDMPEIYPGIYVRQFVMFFGDMVNYYITEETDNRILTTESNRILPDQGYQGGSRRYDRLNEMLMSRVLKEDDLLLEEMRNYKQKEHATEQLFVIL